ncbi:glutamate dehydrogenase [Alicyclobacillus cellulosilyticus]|uniref:Glutamate dehydrogenase n=1 Tax=Alicyclobacillus cellulosilyticus TaxID=1003997 RepID=A0A917KHR1_9BACL|nr:Glu/Leu/Phe/Val dehydrogenase [Alicyclobacillus cellulosilyticus]GGJ10319.1 glutamate dehydrogenase [Alicyclobacillus cellulosilyticus]
MEHTQSVPAPGGEESKQPAAGARVHADVSAAAAPGHAALANTQAVIAEALHVLGYDEQMFELLKAPLRVLTVRFPVRMDDGRVRVFTGFRAQHNDAVGPTMGGIRLQADVREDDVAAWAAWMSVRCGIANLPFGGAMGGIAADPRDLSFAELERLCRAYVRSISQIVGPTKDIPSPDAFSHAQAMAWMFDEYSRIREHDSPGFITGKPQVLGGTRGREGVTARGVALCLEEAAKVRNLTWSGVRVMVQGFGRIGSHVAKYLADAGARVVGISDAHGALYDEDGLDVDALLERRDSFGAVTKWFRNTISNAELLSKPCDVLVLALADHQVTEAQAHLLHAQVVVEAAHAALTPMATRRLAAAGALVVPDVVAHLGSVIASYLEWVQNNQGFYWTEEEVQQRLGTLLRESFHRVYDTARRYKCDMRLAAYIVGVRRLAEAVRWRGWI